MGNNNYTNIVNRKQYNNINWDEINIYKRVYKFCIQVKDIENNESLFPENLNVDFLDNFVKKLSLERSIDISKIPSDIDDIFKYLKEEHHFKYNELLKIFKSILPIKKDEIKPLSDILFFTIKNIKDKILNSNIELFELELDKLLLPFDYEVVSNGDTLSVKKSGKNAAQVYLQEDGGYYLKVYSSNLSILLSNKTGKSDVIRLSDIFKGNNNVSISEFNGDLQSPELKEVTHKISVDTFEDVSNYLYLENLDNFYIDDKLTIFETELNTLYKILFEKDNNSLKDEELLFYNSCFNKKEEENIINSFNSVLRKDKDIISNLAILKEKIIDLKPDTENIINVKQYYMFTASVFFIKSKLEMKIANKILQSIDKKELSYEKELNKIIDKISKYDILDVDLLLKEYDNYMNIRDGIKNEKLLKKVDDIFNKRYILNSNDLDKILTKKYTETISNFIKANNVTEITKFISSVTKENTINYKNLSNNKEELYKLKGFFSKVSLQKLDGLFTDKELDLEKLLNILNENAKQNIKLSNEGSTNEILNTLVLFSILKRNDISSIDISKYSFLFKNGFDILKLKDKLEKIDLIEIDFPLKLNNILKTITNEVKNEVKSFLIANKRNFSIYDKIIEDKEESYKNTYLTTNDDILKDYIYFKKQLLMNFDILPSKAKKFIESQGYFNFFFNYKSFNFDPELINYNNFQTNFINLTFGEKLLNLYEKDNSNHNYLILSLISFIKRKVNGENINIVDFFPNIEKKELLKLENKILNRSQEDIGKLKKQFSTISEQDIILAKVNKINFLDKGILSSISKILISEDIEINKLLSNKYIPLTLPLDIEIKNDKYQMLNFMSYNYSELSNEKNSILKLRTRYSQLTFMTLRMSHDILEGKYTDEKYISFFENNEKLVEFKSSIESNNILSKGKYGVYVNKEANSLADFLKSNNLTIDNMMANFQGYVPKGDLGNLIKKDLENLSNGKSYQLEMLNITKKGELSYSTSIVTPEMVVRSEKELKGGMITGYNLRVTNKNEIDNDKIKNIHMKYFSKYKNELSNFYNIKDFKSFMRDVNKTPLKKMISNIEIINEYLNTNWKTLKNNNIPDLKTFIKYKKEHNEFENKVGIGEGSEKFIMEFYDTPKELASKFTITEDIDLRKDAEIVKKIPTLFTTIISLRSINPNDNLNIHIAEGAKDGMTISNILDNSKNKNQIVIPLQGTGAFKEEYAEFLFNLNGDNFKRIKNWADYDYAGVKLLTQVDNLSKNYNNIEMSALLEITGKDLSKEKYEDIKGSDATDWSNSLFKNKQFKKYQSRLIDSFNVNYSTENPIVKDLIKSSLLEFKDKIIKSGETDKINDKLIHFIDSVNANVKNYSEVIQIEKKDTLSK